MIERVLTLAERPARSIMVPRVDTIWLDIEDHPDAIMDEIRRSGRSRFPVCRREVDEVLGVVHAKDLLAQYRTDGTLDIAQALRQPLFVSETLPILRLLDQFKTSPVHMAIVVDEHGTFEGIVTPTDILVAIAGDLPELAGEETPYAILRDDGSWLLDARMPVDEVERTLALDDMRGHDDFETLAGFVLARLGHLPNVGEGLAWNSWRFEVLQLDGHRIDRVLASPAG